MVQHGVAQTEPAFYSRAMRPFQVSPAYRTLTGMISAENCTSSPRP